MTNEEKWRDETTQEVTDHLNMLMKVNCKELTVSELIELETSLYKLIDKYIVKE